MFIKRGMARLNYLGRGKDLKDILSDKNKTRHRIYTYDYILEKKKKTKLFYTYLCISLITHKKTRKTIVGL